MSEIEKFVDKLKYIDMASDETIKSYVSTIKKFTNWLSERGQRLDEADTQTLEEYLIYLGKQGYSRNSIRRHFQALKKFLTYLRVNIDWESIRVKGEEKYDYVILSEEEIVRIIDYAYSKKEMYGLMLQLGYEGALRASELTGVKVEDLVFDRCALLKHPRKREIPIEVPLSKDLCHRLRVWVEENNLKTGDYLFKTKFGNPWNRSMLTQLIFNPIIIEMGYVDDEGKPTVRYHDFARHSRATNLLRKGVDIYTVNKILGHKLLQTTLIYLHLARAEELRERMK